MRKLIRLFVVLLVLVAVALGAFVFYIDAIARRAVERGATYALGVNTTLDEADVGLLAGRFDMGGLTVANPEGYQTAHFMTLARGGVAVTPASLTRETIELPELTLDGIDVILEKREGKSNFGVILENLERFEAAEPQPQDERGKKYIIRRVAITDLDIEAQVMPLGGKLTTVNLSIDEITLNDVGSENGKGVVLAKLVDILVKSIFAAVVEHGGGVLPADLLGDLAKGLSGLEDLGEFGIEITAGTLQEIEKAADEIGKGLKDLGEKGVEGVGDTLKGIGGLLEGNKKKDGGG